MDRLTPGEAVKTGVLEPAAGGALSLLYGPVKERLAQHYPLFAA